MLFIWVVICKLPQLNKLSSVSCRTKEDATKGVEFQGYVACSVSYEHTTSIALDTVLLVFVICICFSFVSNRKDAQLRFETHCMAYWESIKLKPKPFVRAKGK